MKVVKLGKSNAEVSSLCFGAMYLGSKTNESTSIRLLDQYVEAGGSFVDTANAYARWVPRCQGGESEALLGRWMKARGNRSQLFLASKVGFSSPVDGLEFGASAKQIEIACEASLRRLGTDVLDLYYVHADDRVSPLAERLEAFDRLVRAGKVRHCGASNFMEWRLEEACWTAKEKGWAEYCCVQQRYSYVRPQAGSIYDPHVTVDEEFLDYVRNRGLTILAYSPLLGGAYSRSDREFPEQYSGPDTDLRLTTLGVVASSRGATVNQVVLAWLLQSDPVSIPVIAASTQEQLAELLASDRVELTSDELHRLSSAGNRPATHPDRQRVTPLGAKQG
ncbi:MAG TPA: aldo/keto reductase [Spirochaetia bacterium]|nr:aldo/keto reductase [Spirochaetia bacterium]